VASATHTVDLGDSATLVAKGAGVIVPVTVTCAASELPPPAFPPFPPFPGSSTVGVQVTERSGSRIAMGSGMEPLVCDGAPHTYDVLVRALGAPFKNGTALATASVFACDLSGCHEASDTAEVRISK